MPHATTPVPPASENAIEALYETGYWLFQQRRTTHALAVFRALVHLAPGDELGWLALGACYEEDDVPDQALALYASREARCVLGAALRSRPCAHSACSRSCPRSAERLGPSGAHGQRNARRRTGGAHRRRVDQAHVSRPRTRDNFVATWRSPSKPDFPQYFRVSMRARSSLLAPVASRGPRAQRRARSSPRRRRAPRRTPRSTPARRRNRLHFL